jgi:hypothetical protein
MREATTMTTDMHKHKHMHRHLLSRNGAWVGALLCAAGLAASAQANELEVRRVTADLSKPSPKATYWNGVPTQTVSLMAQPMVAPRPEATVVNSVEVQAVHDGNRIAFRLRWADPQVDEGGRLNSFSDAAALQFPAKRAEYPPAIMMGDAENPVHILHWRAQYQRDGQHGKPAMAELYPNKVLDMYPLEFADHGSLQPFTDAQRNVFYPGRAEGNPQSFRKTGVDEILAAGFGSSAVVQGNSLGEAVWEKGQWTLVITRQLSIEGGSVLQPGDGNYVGFAIWEGGAGEVGSRKSVTMSWLPLNLAAAGNGR